ncbi:MAG TPA: hypothetical protein PKW49_07990 [Paludibacteraceae bacterium]|nr:hypothetical protein [Paludibacteraceae bacterium]
MCHLEPSVVEHLLHVRYGCVIYSVYQLSVSGYPNNAVVVVCPYLQAVVIGEEVVLM